MEYGRVLTILIVSGRGLSPEIGAGLGGQCKRELHLCKNILYESPGYQMYENLVTTIVRN